MNRLIKSEMMRDGKIMGFWCFIIGMTAFIFLTAFTADEKSSIGFINSLLDASIIILIMMFAAYITGHGYSQRTNMYEVMMGNRPLKIIISKCISVGVVIASIVSFIIVTGFVVSSLISSKGIGEALPRLILFIAVLFRASITAVLITMSVRSIGAIALVYFRFMIEMFVVLIYGAMAGNVNEIMETGVGMPRIFNILFYQNQLGNILPDGATAYNVINVISGFIIAVIFWGTVVYYLYKKKDFK